jgi:hypothetical protein
MNIEDISWQTYEFAHQPKTSDWYWAVGIVTVGAVVASIFFNQVVLAILIIVASLSLLLHANKAPRLLEYHLTRRGLIIDKNLYPISTIESFWIDEYENGIAKLILKSTKKMMVYIIVPLVPDITGDEVRHFFFQHKIAEVEHHEPASQQIMECLGF